MAKKNPYVFTIGFDETNPSHVRAAEILNGTKKKAALISNAVLSYVDGVDSGQASEFSLEKAMKSQSLSEVHGGIYRFNFVKNHCIHGQVQKGCK